MGQPKHEWALVECADITVPERARKDMGDLEALAESIRRTTLLQPIGVTPHNVLVFGERRLRAVRDVLKLPKIHARVIDLDAPAALVAEHDENEERKPFTKSERVAIARAVKERAGERRGRPSESPKEIVANCPQLDSGEKTRDHAAKAAGFTSEKEMRRAASVVDRGVPGLVAVMDAGEVSVSAAAAVATLPPDEQAAVVEAGPAAVRARAAEVREAKPEKKPKPAKVERDILGIPVQPHAADAFAELPKFNALVAALRECEKLYGEIVDGPAGAHLGVGAQWVRTGVTPEGVEKGRWEMSHITNAIRTVEAARPSVTDCPYHFNADGPHPEDCNLCRGCRWVPRPNKSQLPPAMTERMKAHYLAGEDS